MDREGFRNRLKQYKLAREENPGLKYWEWKDIPKYDEGGEVGKEYYGNSVSTEENPIFYEEESAKDRYIRAANALKGVGGWSDNLRNEIANEYSIPYLPEKEIRLTTGRYNTGKISTNLLDSIYDSAMRTGVPVDIALGLAGRESTLGIGRGFKKGQSISGTNLMSNWLQIDPDIPSSKDRDRFNDIRAKILFHDNVSDDEYDFSADYIFDDINSRKRLKKMKENPIDNALKFYQSGKYNPGDKKHSQMVEEDARILMSDPAIQKWAKEKGIAYAEGTDGVLESYYNPTTVEGVLAKTALQLADPTGVSSYPDVWYSGKEFLKSPSWSKLGDVGLNTLSALPLMGKITAPYKAAKMTKLLARIEDANALVKGVEKANRLNRVIDTVPELLPVVRRGAEKVQDVTSSLITNPMFNYISNQNKFDLVRNYRNINAAVDAVNISNNTADLTQGIGTLLGYADGGEVTGPPTYEQWDADMNQYNPTILDNASMYWSIEAAKKVLHNEAMKLPGYAEKWTEYQRSLPKPDPDIDEYIDNLWLNENPNNKGYKNGKYYPHESPEGGTMTIGPGFKLGSGSHNISTKEANRGMTKKRLNQEARRSAERDMSHAKDFLNYGQTTNPADTVSPDIIAGLMDLTHLVGPLWNWKKLRGAILEGDLDKIKKESIVTWKDKTGKVKEDTRRNELRNKNNWHY